MEIMEVMKNINTRRKLKGHMTVMKIMIMNQRNLDKSWPPKEKVQVKKKNAATDLADLSTNFISIELSHNCEA